MMGVPNLLSEAFGMRENPFGCTPDPRYLYKSHSHTEARASLIVGLECGLGFQALIAPPGMGKTTILFDVLKQLDRGARTAFLFQLPGDAGDFLRSVALELGSDVKGTDVVEIQDTINRLLMEERRRGRRTILVIDEAQTLGASVLETVRLLSNFETPREKLLQIVLAGQPSLARQLSVPELAQLHQRISIIKTLVPLEREETTSYIEHRLQVAGYRGERLFAPAALELIWRTSHGVPREINTICFNALLLLVALRAKQVDSDIAQEVIGDLEPAELQPDIAPPSPLRTESTEEVRDGTMGFPVSEVLRDPGCGGYLSYYGFRRAPFEATSGPAFQSQLKPLNETEIEQYIASRLRFAEASPQCGPIFLAEAVAAVGCHSRGIPSLINILCEGALVRGFAVRQREITAVLIDKAAERSSAVKLSNAASPGDAIDPPDVLEAARVLLEFRSALQGTRSDRRRWRCRAKGVREPLRKPNE